MVDSGFLGGYYTAESIIIVYHLFSLQQWLGEATNLTAETELIDRTMAVDSFDRQEAARKCRRHVRRFPWVQVVVFGAALATLSYLAIALAVDLKDVDRKYSVVPTIVLAAVFVASSAATLVQGKRRLDTAASQVLD